ncbi:hypothetical protein ACFC01_33090 [Streptomyces mirabilis]|uniref:hypothetical protein n=1 Tax=Streptomyces TaxID=1883 RepID=UPI001C30FCF9|nr:hypothetical protein [Streptomyces sp. GbtcB7]
MRRAVDADHGKEAVAREAKASGSELRLHAVPHPLARLLPLTHTGRAFTIEQPGIR